MASQPGFLTRRNLVQLGLVLGGGWAAGQMLRRNVAPGRAVDAGVAAAVLDDPASPATGPAGATLTLAVFSDYRCGACREAFPGIAAAVAADGAVRVVHKDWPILGPASERAARVALASVGQGIYPALHDRLMTDDRPIDDVMLQAAVEAVGGDWSRTTLALARDADPITARLAANGRQALSLGLTGTPGYLAGRTLVTGAIDAADAARLFAQARDAV